MNINELRIGNWINCNLSYVNKPVRVSGVSVVDRREEQVGIYEEFIYLNEHDLLKDTQFNDQWIYYKQGVLSLDNVSPIKLTEEVILKCGARKKRENLFQIENFEIDIITGIIDNGLCTINEGELILYLHRLQNLYFSIKGKELIIEL